MDENIKNMLVKIHEINNKETNNKEEMMGEKCKDVEINNKEDEFCNVPEYEETKEFKDMCDVIEKNNKNKEMIKNDEDIHMILESTKEWSKNEEYFKIENFFNRHKDKIIELLKNEGFVINKEKEDKPKYPKTFEDCCNIMNISPHLEICYRITDGIERDGILESIYLNKMNNLFRLTVCRDAYYNVSKRVPDYTNESEAKYPIYSRNGSGINKDEVYYFDNGDWLVFSSSEVREEFFNNFEDLIMSCIDYI